MIFFHDQQNVIFIKKKMNNSGNLEDIPFNLKVSYTQELEMKLFIRQPLIDKNFNRYWFVVNNLESEETACIVKKFLQYLELGDLYRIQTDMVSFNWKEKMEIEKEICYDSVETLGVGAQKRKPKNLINMVDGIYKQNQCKEFHGMKFLIIANNQLNPQTHSSLLDTISSHNDPDIYVSIFVNPNIYYEANQKYQQIRKWVEIRNLQGIQRETKNMFYNYKKFGMKRMNIRVSCLNGALFIKENNRQSDWFKCDNEIVNEIIFPKYNKMYVHIIQLRNLGYLQSYNFKVSFLSEDCKSKKYSCEKVFKLRPTRDQFSNIIGYDYVKQNEEMIKVLINVQQSLTYETFSQHEKLDSLKVVGKKALVEIKTLVEQNNEENILGREQEV